MRTGSELQQAQEAYSGPIAKPKISYPHFNAERLFSHEKTGAFSNDKTYFIPNSDMFLLALLNSTPIWFVLSNLAPAVRGGFHELRVQYVETVPIPEASEQVNVELAELAEAAQDAAESRYKLELEITRRIPDLAANPACAKLSTALKEWWTLPDFAAFQREVRKALKVDIPLKQRNEWEDEITAKRAEINALTAEIARLEAEINAKVYELFDLTPAEIELLEANI